ncbi:2-phospho-L-lactate guanylyltransferase [Haloarchaeobius amylolyticus]|uniref:2-phospho-L-lactate guanylyltransferase n=1 Tax=Haloarchaeobius amylolyticus TaxID=1198296 RepID=UPI0022716786|nr:2-phospho-L-lactate guanylyltransferase [Haloarchaeobius amylolyticus]
MRLLVPFAPDQPKTRLSPVLSDAERRAFARVMCEDVLATLRETGREPELLATEPVDAAVPVTVDDRPLTEAVNAALAETEESVAVVMADLALATPDSLDRLFAADGDVVLAPGRGGGTNAFVARHPDFRVDYHGASYLDHREAASEVGAEVAVVDSHRLATDVDEPGDLVEVLVHGDGRTRRWLREHGFRIERGNGRVNVSRVDD